jgi:tetratricopeptide (TPR) repeat protein
MPSFNRPPSQPTMTSRRWPYAALGLALFTGTALARAEDLMDRHGVDADDLLLVERRQPAALARFREAEALLARGEVAQAVDKLSKASTDAPQSGVIARRLCQARIVQGRRAAALAACEQALEQSQLPMTQRAMVGALMMAAPSGDELAQALRLTAAAKKNMERQPWGLAAECDIARRLGDRAMYKRCLDSLETIAPGHYETRRARELGGFAETPAWVPLTWLGLGALSAGTLLHSLCRSLKRAKRRAVAVALSTSTLVVLPGPVSAAEPPMQGETSLAKPGGLSKWKIDDKDPLKSVPTPEQRDGDPLNFGYHLMDLSDKAEEASARGDFAQASKYWEATVLAVPDAAVGYRKTCMTAEQAKDMNRALRYCRAALARDGVRLEDYQRYASILLSKPTPLDPEQMTDLLEIAKHVRGIEGGAALADTLECEHAVRSNDMKRLEQCVGKLRKAAPDDARTITYQWALALGRDQFDEARRQIERARKSGMKPEGIQAMERSTAERSSIGARLKRHSKPVLGAGLGLAVLGVVFVSGRAFSRRRAAKQPASAPPEPSLSGGS